MFLTFLSLAALQLHYSNTSYLVSTDRRISVVSLHSNHLHRKACEFRVTHITRSSFLITLISQQASGCNSLCPCLRFRAWFDVLRFLCSWGSVVRCAKGTHTAAVLCGFLGPQYQRYPGNTGSGIYQACYYRACLQFLLMVAHNIIVQGVLAATFGSTALRKREETHEGE